MRFYLTIALLVLCAFATVDAGFTTPTAAAPIGMPMPASTPITQPPQGTVSGLTGRPSPTTPGLTGVRLPPNSITGLPSPLAMAQICAGVESSIATLTGFAKLVAITRSLECELSIITSLDPTSSTGATAGVLRP